MYISFWRGFSLRIRSGLMGLSASLITDLGFSDSFSDGDCTVERAFTGGLGIGALGCSGGGSCGPSGETSEILVGFSISLLAAETGAGFEKGLTRPGGSKSMTSGLFRTGSFVLLRCRISNAGVGFCRFTGRSSSCCRP